MAEKGTMKMQKTTEAAGMDFHHENFLRRSRYATVFFVLLIAFGAITVLNINTGNVHISVENILKIIFLRQGEEMEYNIIWKIRLPRNSDGSDSGRWTVSVRLSAADIL